MSLAAPVFSLLPSFSQHRDQLRRTYRILAFLLLLIFLAPVHSWGAGNTYYVNPNGGTSAQCTGLVDAPYSGSGTSQPCAWVHPYEALPPSNFTGNNPDTPPRIAGGDTLIIDAGAYMMGYGAPDTGSLVPCNTNWAYSCVMQRIPSGPSASQPTRILGQGWNSGCKAPPQLWGTERASQVLDLTNSSNIEIGCLEITDHSACIKDHVDPNIKCNYTNYPYGTWSLVGIYTVDSNNALLHDLNIHGMGDRGIRAGRVSNWTLQRVHIVANGGAGWDGDLPGESNSSNSGTILFQQVEVGWNGCAEKYPATTIYACWGQTNNGYGDGLGTAKTGGNWVIQDSYFHHNTQDGLDLLYADGTGSVTVERTRSEGSAGDQLKISGPSLIENSVIVGNCAFFQGTNYMVGDNSGGGKTSGDNCRAGGSAIVLQPGSGQTSTLNYNTVVGQAGLIVINTGDSSTNVRVQNNLLIGYPDYISAFTEQAAAYDSEAGASASFAGNYLYNTRELSRGTCPTGNGNICTATDPKITNNIMGTYSTPMTFNPIPLAGSPLIDAANSGAAKIAIDFYSHSRPAGNGYDIGAVEYQAGGGGGSLSASATALVASPNSAKTGQSVKLTATITGSGAAQPTGTVNFVDGQTSLGSVALANGIAVLTISTLSSGQHSITANYSGDGSYAAGAGTTSVIINSSGTPSLPPPIPPMPPPPTPPPSQAQSTTQLTASSKSLAAGQDVTLTAIVSGNEAATPTGSITFADSTTAQSFGAAIPLANGSAAFTTAALTTGQHTITASYSGDDNYAASKGGVRLVVGSAGTPPNVQPINLNQFGLTGSWSDADVGGQGLMLQVFPDTSPGKGILFGGWFTYDGGPAGGSNTQRWYSLGGDIDAASPSTSLTIYANSGGNFNQPPITTAVEVGTATLQFNDCSHAAFNFNFSDGSNRAGTINLTRLDKNVSCTTNGVPQNTSRDYLYSGGWNSKATSGQGLIIVVNPTQSPPQGLFFGGWYTYAQNGSQIGGVAAQRWFTLQNAYLPGSTSLNVDIYQTIGGVFVSSDPKSTTIRVGTAAIKFQSCQAAVFSYNFTAGDNVGISGDIPLVRTGDIAPPGCTF